MPRTRRRLTRKHFRLDASKIERAKKALRTKTDTETIERALDFVIAEYDRNRRAAQAHKRFLQSGVEIRDVYENTAVPREGNLLL